MYNKNLNKMNKETLRMQMLAGVITEGQYKEKVEELAAENLELKSLAKQVYQYFKKIGGQVKLITTKVDVGTKGAWEGGNVLISMTSTNDDQIALDINSAGIGFDQAKKYGEMVKNSFPKAVFTPVNGKYDWNSNPIVSFLITPGKEMSESLNEHFVAGGIVGIGAINQIPSRAKADYEDAFEYFLSQKYPLNEEESVNENAMAVGNEVEHPEGMGTIELVTDYASHADEIDKEIGMDWESMTPKEELTWYKIKGDDGKTYWFDEEELSEFN